MLRGSAEVRRNRPVRINVSRSGIGASVGVRGARLSVGPRGTYITLSAYGVRYRQRIDGKSKRPRPATTEHLITDSGLITTVSVTDLVDASSEQILNAINSRLSSKAWVVPTFVALIALACGLIWADVSEAAGLLVGCGGALTAFIANLIVRRWRSTTIYYELDEQSKKRYGYIEEGCSRLARAAAKWRYVSAAPTTDWKRNAGANVLTRRTPLQVVRQPAPFLKTNVEPWVVSSKGISLVFLPDCLFVWDGKRYGAVPYDRVTVSADTVSFREDRWVPRDTTVIDHTWHFVRKDGGPDRRFNGNRRIPICCYGTVTVCSEHGLYIELCVSNPGCAEEFARYVSRCTVTNNVDRANHATGGPPEAGNLVPYSPLALPSQPVPIASLIPPPSAPIAPLP